MGWTRSSWRTTLPPIVQEVAVAPVNPTVRQQGQTIETNGVNIYYESHGQGDPICRGGSLTGDMRQPYLAGFAARYRVITPDMPGHGGRNPTGTMSYRQLADDIVAFIQALDLRKPIIAGYSEAGRLHSRLACATRLYRNRLPWAESISNTATPNARLCGTRSVTRRHLRWIRRAWLAIIPTGPRGSTKSMDRTAGSRSWFDSKQCGQRH